jgi:FlaA1/EpsC-like NDP-sugar epimerase
VSNTLEGMSPGMRLAYLARSAYRYGPVFVAEVLAFWLVLLAVSASGYGTDGVFPFRAWYPAASLLMVTLAMGAGEARFRLYRRVWSVASLSDAFAIGLVVIEATLLITIINLLFPDGYRPVRILAPILAAPASVIAVGLIRLAPRLRLSGRPTANRLLVVIPDASYYGTVKALFQQPNPEWMPVGVVTVMGIADAGLSLMGIPVMGSASELQRWIRFSQAQGVAFVQSGTIDRAQARALYHECLVAELPVFIVPAAHQWVPHGAASRLRQLSADDLVGREEREIDLQMSALEVRGKTVLVSGAAGSIGSELCRLLATLDPRRLVLLDNNESGLFDLVEELRDIPGLDLREALVSVREREHLLDVFAAERPEIVFHAAAYKHVPMLESHPGQAVLTNVSGTMNMLRCADASGVKKFVLISTDKAASSHSVMGSTKRVCEQFVLAYRGQMQCWAVRFGNVVGSRGSVVPLFERQIEHGGPVTITHRDATRYMMTIREAASLVVSTLAISKPSHLYMLDMGEPISIYDLANDLIRARGLRPGQDIKIAVTGLRRGERMTEELLAPDEGWRPTDHPSIREVISPSGASEEDLAWVVERMRQLAQEGRTDELVRVLRNTALGRPVPVEEPEPQKPDEPRAAEQRRESEGT